MKVAVIDNTCNNGYVMMRYLNDAGIDTDLLVFNNAKGHGDPANDTYEFEYFDRIINTHWKDKGLIWLSRKDIDKYLCRYDFVIGSDYSPALFHRLKRKLDIFFPHGTDLFNYPFKSLSFSRNIKKSVGEWILGKWQYRGIQLNTRKFVFELTNNQNEAYVKRFKNAHFKRQYLTTPLIYIPQYTEENIQNISQNSVNVQMLVSLRKLGYNVVFHHCQQQWANPAHYLFYKGNDKLIRGFAEFVKKNPDKKLKLVMIERGTDVQPSKALISELDIAEHVLWFSFMPRKEVMACIRFADIGVGELGHSWYTYSVVSEFMSMGVPVVHSCNIDYYKNIHNEVYPMYMAFTSMDITDKLYEYFQNPDAFRGTGILSKEWFRKNIVNQFLNFIKDEIKEKKIKN
jgi:glycosyltransferase involved in cell wall biosynthesis